MRRKSKRVAQALCALSVAAVSSQVLANSGIQLPLSQYQAGQEQTTPVTNGGFEVDGVGNLATPTGWTATGTEMFVDPVFAAPPLNPAAIGTYSAQTRGEGVASYEQTAPALAAGKNYVLSAYVWNSGRPDLDGSADGDLATVRISDPGEPFVNNISMVLEGNGTNGQSGSTGRLMYILFNQADVAAWSGVKIELVSTPGTIAGALPNPWAQYDNIAITPAENFVAQKWLSNVSGNWTDDSKWLGGVNPHAQQSAFFQTSKGAIASFTNGITSNQTISVNSARTVAVINFDNALASYLITGPSAITLDITASGLGVTQGVPEINVLSGSHTIAANVGILRNTVLNVVPAGGSLTLAGAFNATGRTVTKRGAGVATVNNLRSGGLVVEGGTFKIAPSSLAAGVSKVTAVSVSSGRLDLTDNKLTTASALGTWGGSAYSDISGLVDSGRGNAANAQWDGSGIVTSDTRAVNNNDLTSIGAIKAGDKFAIADTATAIFASQTVLGSDTLVMFTWGGDANLDGKINIDDYGQIDFNVGSSGSVFGWYNGDFNYDGKINIDDYGIIDFNVSAQSGTFFTAGGASLDGVAAVPEPSAFALGFAAFALLRGRRKRPQA